MARVAGERLLQGAGLVTKGGVVSGGEDVVKVKSPDAARLPEASLEGLRYVEITTDPENVASQLVITRNGGVLVEEFIKPRELGGKTGLKYRIFLRG